MGTDERHAHPACGLLIAAGNDHFNGVVAETVDRCRKVRFCLTHRERDARGLQPELRTRREHRGRLVRNILTPGDAPSLAEDALGFSTRDCSEQRCARRNVA